MYSKFFKRFFDIIFSIVLLIIASPVLLVVSFLLLFANKGKVLFIQARPGLNEKIFYIIKFMTMNERKNINGELLPDNERITGIGKFIRKSSLDELPQLINVLKGDLSLIGPRPLLVDYLPLYNERQRRRHEVRPGITGWAQVNGRNSISWKEKFQYDVWYVDNISLLLDIKIICRTFDKVLHSEGINVSEISTMDAFTGNN
jgi:undecaprenyl phosphate N,N'-diacetylbacillosamine 1-phosphate transferase